MNYPKILRNTAISGIALFLIFLLFKLLDDPNATRSIDSISSTRSTVLFLTGFVFPGFLFGLAVVLGLPARKEKQANKVIYVVLMGILYIALAFASVTSGTRALVMSGVGAVAAVSFAHLLLVKIKLLPFFLVLAFLAGVAAILPMYMALADSGVTDDMKDTMPFLPFLLFPLWHILVGGLIARGGEALKVE